MATVSNLVVELSADNRGLNRGLKNADKQVGRFASNAVKSVAAIGAALTAGLAAAATAAAFEFNKVSKEIDNVAKTALLLNVGVNELQQLQFVANKAGVTTQNLNLGLQRMTRRLGEAARGGGEAKGALEALGVDIDKIAKLSADEQFNTIAKALAGVTDESKQLSLAFKFFDSEGAKIINAIRLGVDDLGADFEELGLGITDSQTKAVQEVSDQFTLLGTITKSIKQNIVANLSGPMQVLLDLTTKWVKSFGGAKSVANVITVSFLKFVKGVGDGIFFLLDLFNRLAFTVKSVALLISETLQAVTFGTISESFRAASLDIIKSIDEIGKRGIELDVKKLSFGQTLDELIEGANALPTTNAEAAKGTGTIDVTGLTQAIANQTGAIQEQTKATKDRIFRVTGSAGATSFTDRPQQTKQVVELEFKGNEIRQLIKAEVREEVQTATRFDRN